MIYRKVVKSDVFKFQITRQKAKYHLITDIIKWGLDSVNNGLGQRLLLCCFLSLKLQIAANTDNNEKNHQLWVENLSLKYSGSPVSRTSIALSSSFLAISSVVARDK